jgi:hypothetical protein
MSAKVDLISNDTLGRTSVHRFVPMRFLYFKNLELGVSYFTALPRQPHRPAIIFL